MNLDKEDLDVLLAIGRKVNGLKPAKKQDKKEDISVILKQILSAIEFLIRKEDKEFPQFPEIKQPIVNLPAPQVTVNPSTPITKWEFNLTKDARGNTTKIIATAIE